MTGSTLVGDVFYIKCVFPEVTKNKYLVLAKIKPNRFFVINTKVSKFIESKPTLLQFQVDVPHADHSTFLTHDSITDCSDIIDTHAVITDSQLVFNNLHDYKVGRLRDYVIENMLAILKVNTTIKTKELKLILSSFESVLP